MYVRGAEIHVKTSLRTIPIRQVEQLLRDNEVVMTFTGLSL